MQINNTLTKVEEIFNVAGSIPGVAIISGPLRILAGLVQTIAGAIINAVSLTALMIYPKSSKWDRINEKAIEQFNHGCLNYFRGFGEYLLGMTIFGSLALLAAQLYSKNQFKPIIPYNSTHLKTESPTATNNIDLQNLKRAC